MNQQLPIKRTLGLIIAIGLLAQTTNADSVAFEDLFEHNNFSKWTQVDGKPVGDGWVIDQGIVHRRHEGTGDIITKKHYKDFELVFEWKISVGGNSGVKYRSKGKLGLEYQVLDDDVHKDGKIPNHRTGAIYDLVVPMENKPVNPVGEWNSARVVVKDNRVEHWLNGIKVAELVIGSDDWKDRFAKSKYTKHEGFGTWIGPILLQDHGDAVWYRHVWIKEI
jgi:hypothetical protein